MSTTRARVVLGLSALSVVLLSCSAAIFAQVTLSAFLRYWGLVLELVGLGTIAWGLVDLRSRFSDRPGLLATIRQRANRLLRRAEASVRRLLRRPRAPAVVTLGVASSDLSLLSDVLAEVTYGPVGADVPMEQRLAELEQRTRDLRRLYNDLRRQVRADARARATADADERVARTAAVEELDRRVADLAVGGLTVEWWGLAALVVGTVLDAIPDELAQLLT